MFRRSDWRSVGDTVPGHHQCHCECVSEPWTAAASCGGTDSSLWFCQQVCHVPPVFTLHISCLEIDRKLDGNVSSCRFLSHRITCLARQNALSRRIFIHLTIVDFLSLVLYLPGDFSGQQPADFRTSVPGTHRPLLCKHGLTGLFCPAGL